MFDINADEDQAANLLRQVLAQTERLQKQTQRLSRENFNLEEANELLVQLDQMDTLIT